MKHVNFLNLYGSLALLFLIYQLIRGSIACECLFLKFILFILREKNQIDIGKNQKAPLFSPHKQTECFD